MNPRSKAREFTVQAVYQWLMTEHEAKDIEEQFIVEHDMQLADFPYFQELLHEVVLHKLSLVDLMFDHLDRPFDQIDPVEQAILLLSCYELQSKPDVPYRVAINEGVELAKTFGAEDGYKFINGILDKIAMKLRADEIAAKKKR
ncbi:MAG: transcription antitermination factor NusB [Gammaproteobacteria bacterium]|nr:transcription antitermination factor NusB [Gammaproteobacteria bacterium]